MVCGALLSTGACAEGSGALLVSDDGQTVMDENTGLRWSRCVEGMRWDGQTCTGSAEAMAYNEALKRAMARSQSDGRRWRVPSFVEQKHLLGLLRKAGNAWSSQMLPGSSAGCHWSSSISIDTSTVNPYAYGNVQRGLNGQTTNQLSYLHVWCIDMGTSRGREASKRERLPVRLVSDARP